MLWRALEGIAWENRGLEDSSLIIRPRSLRTTGNGGGRTQVQNDLKAVPLSAYGKAQASPVQEPGTSNRMSVNFLTAP